MLTGLVIPKLPTTSTTHELMKQNHCSTAPQQTASRVQTQRRGETEHPINDNIIFQAKNTGYVFKDGITRSTNEDYLPNCSTVLITAAQKLIALNTSRPGFTIAIDGTLTKIAVNSGSKQSPSRKLGRKNTTEERELIEWQELNSSIIQEKQAARKA